MDVLQQYPPLKFGKTPATYDLRTLKFAKYLTAELPQVPPLFGHESIVTDYGMCGNANYGDCVWAAAAHETMLWNAECKIKVQFSETAVLSDYAVVTGFNPVTGEGDNGTDMKAALNYRRTTGVVDADGLRHKIGAYVALDLGNMEHLYAAMYLFGAVEIGIQFPESAQDQFHKGETWSVVEGAVAKDGHAIPLVAKRDNLIAVTWGRIQQMTKDFYIKYCDESYAILSLEMLKDGKTLDGFNLAQLQADLAAL